MNTKLTQKWDSLKASPQTIFGKVLLKLLRENSSICLQSDDDINLDDFTRTLGKQTVVFPISITGKYAGFFYFDEELLYLMVDRIMGGTRAPYIKKFGEGVSKIDKTNIVSILREFVSIYGQYFFNAPADFELCLLPFDGLKLPSKIKHRVLSFEVQASQYGGHFSLGIDSNFI